MEDKFCIVIDERDQSQRLRSIKRKLKLEHGINLIETQINLSQSKYHTRNIDNSPIIDIDKVISEIESLEYFRRTDVIAVDYNLGEGLNGFDIIQKIRALGYKRKKEIILYSAGIEKAIDDILKAEDFKNRNKKIKNLVRANISFLKAGQFADEIIRLIKQEPLFDFDSELTIWLYKFKDHTFLSSFPPYIGKRFQEIASEIEANTHQSVQFKKQLLEQIFSTLIDLNEIQE